MSTDESRKPEEPAPAAPGARAQERSPADDEPVPRLPRGRGLSLSGPEILRILMFAALLVALVVLRKPCSDSAGKFIKAFEPPPDAGPAQAAPRGDTPLDEEALPGKYIRLTPDMSEDEIRQKIEQLVAEEGGDAGVASGPDAPDAAAADQAP